MCVCVCGYRSYQFVSPRKSKNGRTTNSTVYDGSVETARECVSMYNVMFFFVVFFALIQIIFIDIYD